MSDPLRGSILIPDCYQVCASSRRSSSSSRRSCLGLSELPGLRPFHGLRPSRGVARLGLSRPKALEGNFPREPWGRCLVCVIHGSGVMLGPLFVRPQVGSFASAPFTTAERVGCRRSLVPSFLLSIAIFPMLTGCSPVLNHLAAVGRSYGRRPCPAARCPVLDMDRCGWGASALPLPHVLIAILRIVSAHEAFPGVGGADARFSPVSALIAQDVQFLTVS